MGQHRCDYQVGDWKKYNKGLRDRYSLEVWFPPAVVKKWYHQPKRRKQGAQRLYSRTALLICHQLRALFNLSLRATQGFLDSFFERLKLPIRCPDYSLLSRRLKDLKTIPLPRKTLNPLFALVDSTGLKVYGQGEWHVKKHKASRRRVWRKLHLIIDPISQEILHGQLTPSREEDAKTCLKMLPKLSDSLQNLWGDGAYDQEKIYQALYDRKIKPIIPPRKDAAPSCFYRRTKRRLGKTSLIHPKPHMKPRDTAREYIQMYAEEEEGRLQWKKHSSYHLRSLVETAMMRFKQTFSDRLNARKFVNQQAEAHLKTLMLNKMTQITQAYSFPTPKTSLIL